MGFIEFNYVLLGFTGFYQVLLGFRGFYGVLLGFTGFYLVLPSFTGSCWVLLGFTGFYQVIPGFTGFYRVLWVGLPSPALSVEKKNEKKGRNEEILRHFIRSSLLLDFGSVAAVSGPFFLLLVHPFFSSLFRRIETRRSNPLILTGSLSSPFTTHTTDVGRHLTICWIFYLFFWFGNEILWQILQTK